MYQYYSPSLIREKPSATPTLYDRPVMSTASSSTGSTASGVAQRSSTWQDRLQGPQTPLPHPTHSQKSTRAPVESVRALQHSPTLPTNSVSKLGEGSYLISLSSPLLPTPPIIPRIQSLLRPPRQAYRLVLPHHRLGPYNPGSLLVRWAVREHREGRCGRGCSAEIAGAEKWRRWLRRAGKGCGVVNLEGNDDGGLMGK